MPAVQPKRNARHYIDTVTFLVKDDLYKVERAPFIAKSHIFRDMFTKSPQIIHVGAADATTLQLEEGLVDALPIRLEQTKKDDFEALLDIMFPKTAGLVPTFPLSQWQGVRELSRRWLMKEYYFLACRGITAFLSPEAYPMETIRFARLHMWPEWLILGYLAVVTRSDLLSAQEAQELGLEVYFGILGPHREHYIKKGDAPQRSSYYYEYEFRSAKEAHTSKIRAEIASSFAEEVAKIQAELDTLFSES